MSSKGNFLGDFFADPERPMWQKAAAGFLGFLIIFFIIKPSNEAAVQTEIQDSFPSDGGLLADSDPEADRLAALTLEKKREIEKFIKAPKAKPEEDLKAEQFSKEAQAPKATKEEEKEGQQPNKNQNNPFATLDGMRKGIGIFESANNDLWLYGDNSVVFSEKGELRNRKTKLNSDLYDSEFEEDLKKISSLFTASNGDVWLGLSNGLLLRYKRYEWQKLTQARKPISGVISDFAEFQGKIYVASKGLWHWDESFSRMLGDDQFRGYQIYDLEVVGDTLYIASEKNLWQLKEGVVQKIWTASRKDRGAFVVKASSSETLLVGTSDGLITLSKKGVILDRALSGEQITSIAEVSPDDLWVGTLGHGLRYWNGKKWHKNDSHPSLGNSIFRISIDSASRIWIRGTEFVNAPVATAKNWIQKFPEIVESFNSPKIYKNACDAVEDLLPKVQLSGSVSSGTYDGQRIVFFQGKQVCPNEIGFRNLREQILLLRSWNITIFDSGKRSSIEVPKEFPADKTTFLFIDSKERIWIGSDNGYLYQYQATSKRKEDAWQDLSSKAAVSKSRLTGISEDAYGGIWITSAPKLDKAKKRYKGKPLHYLPAKGTWKHRGIRDGLSEWRAFDILILPSEQVVVAGGSGFSIIEPDGEVFALGRKEKYKPSFSYSISSDKASGLWMAHSYFGDGLTWFDGSQLNYISKKEGLFDNRILEIAHDRSGRVWVQASNGSTGVYPRAYLEKRRIVKPLPKYKAINLSSGTAKSKKKAR